ncbi:MAG: helix-turn-helix domain-containing protein [Clostridia bacterium]|nr:helix-turn-helix domain-containing protein [Clostridia bacterium]
MDSSPTPVFSKKWSDDTHGISVRRKVINKNTRMHMHAYYEIEIILCGGGYHNLNGCMYPLKKGSAYFLSPADFHCLIIPDDLELLNIEFDNNTVSKRLLNSLINRSSNNVFELNDDDLNKVLFIVSMLEEPVEDVYSDLDKKNLLECLLIFLLRHADLDGKDGGEDLGTIDPIYKCMRYLFLHFNEAPSLGDMARISGYSASYFSKHFHEITGKKYVDFLMQLRLNHAKLLLITTKKHIIEICAECGFSSLSNFNHMFKKEFGVSPSQYRRAQI